MTETPAAEEIQSDESQEFVRLVKSLDVKGLAAFLAANPHFDCNRALFERRLYFGGNIELGPALYWLFIQSPGHETTWLEDTAETQVARLLVQHGADLRSPIDEDGGTLLHVCRPARRLLLALGMDPNVTNHAGQTPLHIAATAFEPDGVKLLLEAGATVDRLTNAGNTPLHMLLRAVTHLEDDADRPYALLCFGHLLDAGASLISMNRQRTTPLHVIFGSRVQRNLPALEEAAVSWLAGDIRLAATVRAHLQRTPTDLTVELPSSACLKVHRWLMSESSEMFRAMMDSGMREATEGKLVLSDVPVPTVHHLVEFVYGKPLPGMKLEHLVELVRLADKMLCHGLKQFCAEQLGGMINEASVIDIMLLATSMNLHQLRRSCINFIAENYAVVTPTSRFIAACDLPEFPALMKEILQQTKAHNKRKRDVTPPL